MTPQTCWTPFDGRELIGRWSAAVGTFAALMDEEWHFHLDGTGRAVLGRATSSRADLEFEWRPLEVGALEVRLLEMHIAGEADEEQGAEDAPEPWQRLSLVIGDLPNEAGGSTPAIRTPPSRGFWLGLFPLARIHS